MYERDWRTNGRRWREPSHGSAPDPLSDLQGEPSRVRVVTRGVAVVLIALTGVIVSLVDEPGGQLTLAATSGHLSSVVRALAFDPHGRAVHACTADGVLVTWKPGRTPTSLAIDDGHLLVRRPEFAPDASLLAVSTSDGGVTLWDLVVRQRRFRIEPGVGLTTSVTFSRDGVTLAVADAGGIRLLDVASGAVRGEPLTLPGVSSLAFAPDGRTLAIGGQDGLLRVWDLAEREPSVLFQAHRSYVTRLVYSPDGRTLVSMCYDGHVARVWRLAERRLLAELDAGSHIQSLVFAPDGGLLATADFRGMLQIWDYASGRRSADFLGLDGSPLTSLAFSADGKTLACGDTNTIAWYQIGDGDGVDYAGSTPVLEPVLE